MSNYPKRLTIMPTPAPAWARDRSPSDRLSVRQFPTMAVSAESRLMSSPVRVLSKNPTSCFKIEEKRVSRKFRTICCPVKAEKDVLKSEYSMHAGQLNESHGMILINGVKNKKLDLTITEQIHSINTYLDYLSKVWGR